MHYLDKVNGDKKMNIKEFNQKLKEFPVPNKRQYKHCLRYELAPKSSIYAHNREYHSWFAATGSVAEEFCYKHLGEPTKSNGHGHYEWYLYS